MDLKLYRYGISNTLNSIEESLEYALTTKNKREKARYIGEAYGMVRAVNMLINEEDREEIENENKKTKTKT